MSESDTPRTDAAEFQYEGDDRGPYVHRGFARQLERELAKAKRNDVANRKSIMELIIDRDHWKERATRLSKYDASIDP